MYGSRALAAYGRFGKVKAMVVLPYLAPQENMGSYVLFLQNFPRR